MPKSILNHQGQDMNRDALLALAHELQLKADDVADYGIAGMKGKGLVDGWAKRIIELAQPDVQSEWQDIASAPISTPLEQVYFLASCPDDPWSPGGVVHFACRYTNDVGECRPVGTSGRRKFTGWMPVPLPKEPT